MKNFLIISLLLLPQASMASEEIEQTSCKPSVKIGLFGAALGITGIILTASAIAENSYTIKSSHDSHNWDTCNTPETRTDKNIMGILGMNLLLVSGAVMCHAYHVNKSEQKEDEEQLARQSESHMSLVDQANEEAQDLIFNENTDLEQDSEA